jgi:hypothetical protein
MAVAIRRAWQFPAEAADRAFLDGDQHLVVSRQLADQVGGRAAWQSAHRRRWWKARGVEILGRDQAFGQPCAEGQERHLRAFAHDPALADFQDRPRSGISTPTPSPRG